MGKCEIIGFIQNYFRTKQWQKSRKETGVIFTRHGKLWMSDAAEEALREQLGYLN